MEEPDQDVSIAEIATRAGMTSAAVYYHFSNREELLDALRSRLNEKCELVMRPQPDEDDIEDWLCGVVARVAEWVITEPNEARFMFVANQLATGVAGRSPLSPWETVIKPMTKHVLERTSGLSRTDATMRAMALLSLLAELAVKRVEMEPLDATVFGTFSHAAHVVARELFIDRTA